MDADRNENPQVPYGQCWRKKLELRLKRVAWKSPVVIEYTARDTPQQNSPVGVGFYALVNKAHPTMHHANLQMEMKY